MIQRLAALATASLLTLAATVTHARETQVSLVGSCVRAGGEAEPGARLLTQRLAERGIGARNGPGDCHLTIRFQPAPGLGEGYRIHREGSALLVSASARRGYVYAAGWLLSHVHGNALDWAGPVEAHPALTVRGDQIGIRAKNNSFDAWTPAMLARHVDDLALMGANRIQLVGPVSDDAGASPLAPVPAMDAILATAREAKALGLEVALYQPLLRDYAKPGADSAELAAFTDLIARFPALDAVYFPGGDPGNTHPDLLFPLLAKLAVPLRARFPKAELLVSTQGFDETDFLAFVAQIRKRPAWLSAVFVGPQTRGSIARHRELIGGFYPLELYPDTAHAMHAQLPVQHWSPVFALTEGREPVNPRPAAMVAAFRDQTPGTRGFIAYSEGVNDDWNVAQWLALSWNPKATESDAALRYARLFIGDDRFAGIPQALERNWRGDPADNPAISATLRQVDALHPASWADWRVDLYRYRAVYDSLVAARWRTARNAQVRARAALEAAPDIGAQTAAKQALLALAPSVTPREAHLYSRLETLAGQLWQRARMQLSVASFGASNWERGANLDRAMIDLTDRAALMPRIAAALALPTRAAQAAALVRLGDRADTRDHALYDDLGNAGQEPHLVAGPGELRDPQGRASAIDGVADHLPQDGWTLSELSYAEALYEQPLQLHYTHLPSGQTWCLRYTWAGEGYWRALQISVGGEVISPFHNRTGNPAYEQIAIPPRAIRHGTLDITFASPPGAGGSGRGRQIAESWLVPMSGKQCAGGWPGP